MVPNQFRYHSLYDHLFWNPTYVYVDLPLKIEWPKCLAIFLKALGTFCNAFSLHKFFFSAPWAFSKTSFSANKCSDKWYLNKVLKKITVKIKSFFFLFYFSSSGFVCSDIRQLTQQGVLLVKLGKFQILHQTWTISKVFCNIIFFILTCSHLTNSLLKKNSTGWNNEADEKSEHCNLCVS